MAHIVIVEDDDILSELLAEELAAAGHSLTLVEDGVSAVEQICAKVPDVVLLDCGLPIVSGAGVMDQLRERMPGHDIPIIVISARAQEDFILSMMFEGASAYFVKPLNLKAILEAIDQEMALKASRRRRVA